jgi:hypothetical protein
MVNNLIGGGTFASQSEKMTGAYVSGIATAHNSQSSLPEKTSIRESRNNWLLKIENYARTGAFLQGQIAESKDLP